MIPPPTPDDARRRIEQAIRLGLVTPGHVGWGVVLARDPTLAALAKELGEMDAGKRALVRAFIDKAVLRGRDSRNA